MTKYQMDQIKLTIPYLATTELCLLIIEFDNEINKRNPEIKYFRKKSEIDESE